MRTLDPFGFRWRKPPINCKINWAHPLARGLVCAYLLQESGTRWLDYTRLGRDLATATTSTAIVQPSPGGYAANSARFLAANIETLGPGSASAQTMLPTPPITYVASIVRTAASNNPSTLMGFVHTATGVGFYLIDIYNSKARAVAHSGVSGSPATGATTINNNTRYVIGGVFNSTASRLVYVNGVQDGSDTTSVSQPAGLDAFALGCIYSEPSGANFLDGWMDWAYYYNRALPANEMRWLYESPFDMFMPTTLPLYQVVIYPPVTAVALPGPAVQVI